MSFLHPSYLWALIGLAFPIAIHLWSNKEAKTIKIGSVQLLWESKSKQSSSIQWNELGLLFLRMLIISLVTLVMAKPQWHSKVIHTELTYIIEPSLVENEGLKGIWDSLPAKHEIRLLKKGFPILEPGLNEAGEVEIPNYWQLASEMDALKTDSIIVFTKGYEVGLKGMRPETAHHINWMVLDDGQSVERPLVGYQQQGEIQLFSVVSTSNRTTVIKENLTAGASNFSLTKERDSLKVNNLDRNYTVPIIPQNPIEVSLYYADSLVNDKMYIEAAFAALSNYLDQDIRVVTKSDSLETSINEVALTIWLSAKPYTTTDEKLLMFKEDSFAQSLIEPGLNPNTYYLTNRINPDNAVSEHLTEHLLKLLDINNEVRELLPNVDLRSVTETDLRTNYKQEEERKSQQASWDLGPYLWSILLVFLVLERMVANKRKQ